MVWQKFADVSEKHTAYIYNYTLKIEMTSSPQLSVKLYQMTRRHIPEYGNLPSHHLQKIRQSRSEITNYVRDRE
jgi:hypothetical protein